MTSDRPTEQPQAQATSDQWSTPKRWPRSLRRSCCLKSNDATRPRYGGPRLGRPPSPLRVPHMRYRARAAALAGLLPLMVLPSAAPAVLANTAAVVPGPMCLGYRVTILGTPGDDVITGTSGWMSSLSCVPGSGYGSGRR